ncbi:hypothetical protein KSP40_PGU004087 [Platanthera guangdongensis]|uniref:diaminohydroxyphosphoribosylaminopyrimidine deaminase n=1 Tax=Platanthera guangdongensis TaxID=2320717 RepID=A0ABR2LXF8_9ASPA
MPMLLPPIFEVRREGLAVPSQVENANFRASRNRRGISGAVCKKMDDAFYMRRCVELAKKAIGCTSPNPMVGCVIVKDGEIVGQGFHPKAGQPHAEVFALRDAGKLAENATAYVSLEPCNHYGRTPPCTEALINANIKQVIIGMVDPNPIVASKGVEKLKASGIDVIVGVEEMLCQKLNEAYPSNAYWKTVCHFKIFAFTQREAVKSSWQRCKRTGWILFKTGPRMRRLRGFRWLLDRCLGSAYIS